MSALLLLMACKLPEAEPAPLATWEADCDGWSCPGANSLEWFEGWAACSWDCACYLGLNGVEVRLELEQDDEGCWGLVRSEVDDGDCSWLSY